MAEERHVSTLRLIAVPALITLAITVLRLVGELKHWPAPWFSTAAGGGAAVVGISWLPIIFGLYFALKLAAANEGPGSYGRAIGFSFLGFFVFVLAGALFGLSMRHASILTPISLLLMLAASLGPLFGWPALGRVLLAYAFAARIPVVIVMYLAMTGNNGAGWGTHYDAVPPMLASMSLGKRFLMAAVAPQLTLWIGWTVITGAIVGGIVAAIARGKRTVPAAV